MSVDLIADQISQRIIWTFLVQFLREGYRMPFLQDEPPIRIEDLRAYATPDGLRELFTESELDDRSIAVLVYRYELDGGWERPAWKEVGYRLEEHVSASVVTHIHSKAQGQITRFLLNRKRQLG